MTFFSKRHRLAHTTNAILGWLALKEVNNIQWGDMTTIWIYSAYRDAITSDLASSDRLMTSGWQPKILEAASLLYR